MNQEYFFPTKEIRTKIYENMGAEKNEAIAAVIHGFVSNWSRITEKCAFSFTGAIQHIRSYLNPETIAEVILPVDPNNSVDQASIEELRTTTFRDVFEMYKIRDNLYLPAKMTLQPFYTSKRLGKIKVDKDESLIPTSIENLVFLHFFSKLSRDFLEKYQKTDIETRSNQFELLELWKNFLRELYELIREANSTILRGKDSKEFHCEDLDMLFNFVCFTFESLHNIKKITGRELSTHSELKTKFEKLLFKKEEILSYIIKNQKEIKEDQPVHYYNLYLQIVSSNANKDIARDMEFVFLHVHELKAYSIAKKYLTDNEKIVQAIRSLAFIAEKYQTLSKDKREAIKIRQIEAKMARLLKIVGQ